MPEKQRPRWGPGKRELEKSGMVRNDKGHWQLDPEELVKEGYTRQRAEEIARLIPQSDP